MDPRSLKVSKEPAVERWPAGGGYRRDRPLFKSSARDAREREPDGCLEGRQRPGMSPENQKHKPKPEPVFRISSGIGFCFVGFRDSFCCGAFILSSAASLGGRISQGLVP